MTLALLGGPSLRSKPFLPHPVLGEEERKAVLKVLDSGMLSGFAARAGDMFLGGPVVRDFEQACQDYFKIQYAMAVNSATSGLHAAIAACGVGPGDEVIVTPYTMSASASAILHANAIPVFADVDPEIFCIDPASIKNSITSHTKAIIVVHLFGHSADMDEIMKLAGHNGIKVIEDCAQAPGGTYKGRKVGTLGSCGVFSFNMNKTVTCGEGGMVVTNDSKIAEKVRLVRNHGEVCVEGLGCDDIVNTLGWNYRMTELDAAVALEQFKKLEFLTEHRIRLANYLSEKLPKIEGIQLPKIKFSSRHTYFTFPILVDSERLGVSRDLFVRALVAEGIQVASGYVRPLYLEKMFQEKIAYGKDGCPFKCPLYHGGVRYEKGLCPVAEELHDSRLFLTTLCRYPLSLDDMDDIVRAFEKVITHRSDLQRAFGHVGSKVRN